MAAFSRHLARTVVGLGLLSAAIWWASPGAIMPIFLRTNTFVFVPLIVMLVQIAMAAERWRLLVASIGHQMRFRDALRIGFVSSLAGQILPGGVGVEVARIGMGRLTGLKWSHLLSLAFIDRLLLLSALATLAACCILLLVPSLRLIVIQVFGCLILVTGFISILFALNQTFHAFVLSKIASTLKDANIRLIPILFAAILALLGTLNLAFCAWLLAIAMQIDFPFTAAISWIPLVMAAASVPASLGGWGVREAAAVALLSQAGIAPSEALALSIGLGLIGLLAALPGAFMMPAIWRKSDDAVF